MSDPQINVEIPKNGNNKINPPGKEFQNYSLELAFVLLELHIGPIKSIQE